MLSDMLFLLVSLVSFILFVMAFYWKKNHFIKDLYVDQSVALLCIYVFVLTIQVVPYVFLLREQNMVDIFASISACMDLVLLIMCVSWITTCVYLEGTNLVYKNIFVKKKIDLLGEDVILIEKTDKKIIVSEHCKITINLRFLSGDINRLFYRIVTIMNH